MLVLVVNVQHLIISVLQMLQSASSSTATEPYPHGLKQFGHRHGLVTLVYIAV